MGMGDVWAVVGLAVACLTHNTPPEGTAAKLSVQYVTATLIR